MAVLIPLKKLTCNVLVKKGKNININISKFSTLFKTSSHVVVPVKDDEQGRGARRQEQHTIVRKAIRM